MSWRRLSKFVIMACVLVLTLVTGFLLIGPFSIYSESSVFNSPCSTDGLDPLLVQIADAEFKDLKLSGAYLVSQNNQILARGYCGTSDPKSRSLVLEETKFNIGSLSKQFTGYLLYQLIQEKKIALSDLVSDYIAELKDQPAGKVTIEQLMLMRSGIAYVPPMRKFIGPQLSNRIHSEQELIEVIANLDLDFKPGEKFGYSNLGYSLIGIIIGRVEHSSWSESVRRRIFEPFGMKHSGTEGDNPNAPENLAVGLLPFDFLSRRFFLRLPHWNYSMIKGAGGIVTTVTDLHLWNKGLSAKAKNGLDGTYFPSGIPSDENYSYGWILSESKIDGGTKITTINHGGEDPGYCATAIRVPSLNANLIITLNSDYCLLKDGALRPFTKSVLKYLSSKEK